MDKSTNFNSNSRLQVLRRNTDTKVHGNRVDTAARDAYIMDVPGLDDLDSGPDVAPGGASEKPCVLSNLIPTDPQLDDFRIQNPPNLNSQTFTEEPESRFASSSVQVLTDNTTAMITNNTIRTVSGDMTITTGRGLATVNPNTIRTIGEMFTAMKQTSTVHRSGAYAAAAPLPINQANYYAYPSPQQQFHTPDIGGLGQGFGFGQATGISSASTSPYLFQANSQVLTLENHSSNTHVGMNNTGPGAEIWVSPSNTRRMHTLDQPLPLGITSPGGGFGGNPAQSYTSWNTRTLTTDSESGAGMYVASPTEYDSPLSSPNPNTNSTGRNPFRSG